MLFHITEVSLLGGFSGSFKKFFATELDNHIQYVLETERGSASHFFFFLYEMLIRESVATVAQDWVLIDDFSTHIYGPTD